MQERLVANAARFPDQTIDDETILFDAETGHVILLAGFASTLWTHLAGGVVMGELSDAMAARYGAEAGAATRAFLTELTEAGMLIASNEPAAPAATIPAAWPAQFTAPVLERYDDIAKIIAMDPIHDVDISAGWPRPAPGKS